MKPLVTHRQRIYATLLLGLFAGLFYSSNFFYHTHVIDGNVVVHSHPYAGDKDNPNHVHSDVQLTVIERLAKGAMVSDIVGSFEDIALDYTVERVVSDVLLVQTPILLCPTLRGPPAL